MNFLLVAHGLASSVTAMSAQGWPVTDTRSDVAVEYLSARTLPLMMILLLPAGRLRGDRVQLQGGHDGADGHPGKNRERCGRGHGSAAAPGRFKTFRRSSSSPLTTCDTRSRCSTSAFVSRPYDLFCKNTAPLGSSEMTQAPGPWDLACLQTRKNSAIFF